MRLTRLGWALLGFTVTLLLAWGVTTVWTFFKELNNGFRITRIERIVAGQHRRHQGGDALQPASAGQQPSPAPAGGRGGRKVPPRGGSGPAPRPSESTPKEPAASPDTPQSELQPAPPSAGTPPTPPQSSPPSTVAPKPPGLLDPTLTTVCSAADQFANLC